MKKRIRLKDCTCPVKQDIDVDAVFDARQADCSVNRCINAVTDCLRRQSSKLDTVAREHLIQIFLAMRHAHRAVRELLRSDGKDPAAVSAMSLVRVQVENLFAICLIAEKPESLAHYLKDGWKKLYVRHLLMRQESSALPRMTNGLKKLEPELERMRQVSGVTEAEKSTIDFEELGVPLPSGMALARIPGFPTPADVVERVQDSDRKKMLTRLYPEYQFLCSFVHFSPAPAILATLLDERQPFRRHFTTGQVEEIFQKEIAIPALWFDQISVVQSCCEIFGVFPDDIELARAVTEAWAPISKSCLVGQAIWEVRTKKLLGALG
jgi:hypothetical protein